MASSEMQPGNTEAEGGSPAHSSPPNSHDFIDRDLLPLRAQQVQDGQQQDDSPFLNCDIASFDLSESGFNMTDWNLLWHQWEYYGVN